MADRPSPDIAVVLPTIWNWLPAFRAVAETEHLPTAARRLGLSTSAVSRTLKLLESHLEVELFNRAGRSLVLNTRGEALLGAVRQAMDAVEDGLGRVTSDPYSGPLKISSLGLLTNHFVVPAATQLKRAYPGLKPVVENLRTSHAYRALLAGQIHVAFTYEAVSDRAISIELLGKATAGIYCGVDHPLFDREVSLAEVARHEFSIPAIGDTGQVMDGWPVEIPRAVGMQITLLTTNLQVCLEGQLVTVLPDVTAYPHLVEGHLRRFPFEVIAPIDLYACTLAAEGRGGVIEELVGSVRQRIADATAEVGTRM